MYTSAPSLIPGGSGRVPSASDRERSRYSSEIPQRQQLNAAVRNRTGPPDLLSDLTGTYCRQFTPKRSRPRLCRPAAYHEWALAQTDSRPELADLIHRSAILGRLNSLRRAETRWRQIGAGFADCLRPLGIARRDFVLTARDDLGQGRRRWQS